MKKKNNRKGRDRARLTAIVIISLLVIITGALFSAKAFMNKDIPGGILGIIIALIILSFAVIVYRRGNRDLKNGYPLHDERSRRVLEKASSTSVDVSLYRLLAVGFGSDALINFRDVSQATGISVGGMAILFLIFWAYYNKKHL